MDLTGRQKRHLRGLGHALHPVVMVGHEGASEGVIHKAAAELRAHELIKVRVIDTCEAPLAEVAEALATGTDSALVQTIGHTFLLYKRRAKDPHIVLPTRD